MADPGSLLEIALDAIGKYIYGLCSRLTMISHEKYGRSTPKKRKLTNSLDIQQIKQICINLHNMLADVPINLANDLTNKLLDSVDNWEYEIGNCKKGSIEEKIYEEVVMSIIHPGLTGIEHGQELLECYGIFSETVFCSSLCVSVLMKNIHSLRNLRKLYVLHPSIKCNFTLTEFPEHLVEFSGRCNNGMLTKIMKSCKCLKYLDVLGSKGVTDISVDVLLKMNHLEKLNITNTGFTNKGIKRFVIGLVESYGNSPPLKYFAFSCKSFQNFTCLENLPHLKIGLQLYPNKFAGNVSLSELCSFRNICELQIGTTLINVNKLLREIGKQLVYLDIEIEHFGPLGSDDDEDDDDEENWDIAEILKIGQYCSGLKCLHISIDYYFFPRMVDFRRPALPGFQTVRCLSLEIQDEDTFKTSDYLYFLISQCSNVRKITLAFDKRIFNMHEFICNAVQFDYMKKAELICFQPFCDKCSIADLQDENNFVQSKVNEILTLLIAHCSSLRIIGLDPIFERRLMFNPQRLKFVPTWCRCK